MGEMFRMPLRLQATLQGEIMSYRENPAAKIRPRLVPPQMLEKSQEYFLNDLFGIRDGHSARKQIAKDGEPELLKQRNHLFFQPGRPELCGGYAREGKGGYRIRWGRCHFQKRGSQPEYALAADAVQAFCAECSPPALTPFRGGPTGRLVRERVLS
jgi:hypothetical protein